MMISGRRHAPSTYGAVGLALAVMAVSATGVTFTPKTNVIPITSNSLPLTDPSGQVILDNVLKTIDYTKAKYTASLLAYQENTGQPFPGTKWISPKFTAYPSFTPSKRQKLTLSPQSGASFWTGNVTVGTQQFRVDFDTGSADLWIPNINCTSTACTTKSRYNDSMSKSTSRLVPGQQFSIRYVDGSGTSGPVFTDTVSVAGIASSTQYFSPVTYMKTTLDNDPVDGILGLGYQSLSSIRQKPVFVNAWSTSSTTNTKIFSPNKQLKNNYFAFALSADVTGGSELCWGCVNSDKYSGNISWYPVTQRAYWTIGSATAYANGKATGAMGLSTIIDTGTTLIYAPNSTVAAMFASVTGVKYYTNGFWTFACNSLPTIGFSWSNGSPFTIPARSLSLGCMDVTCQRCLSAIIGQPLAGNSLLVGDLFLKNVYSVYNFGNNTVGFANLPTAPKLLSVPNVFSGKPSL